MRFLTYHDLDIGKLGAKLKKVRGAVERDDFKTPNIKKLVQDNYYRAKLNWTTPTA